MNLVSGPVGNRLLICYNRFGEMFSLFHRRPVRRRAPASSESDSPSPAVLLADRRAFLKMLGLGSLAAFLDACDALQAPTPTPALLPPITAAPAGTPTAPDGVARAFFQAWTRSDYSSMYDFLSAKAKAKITRDDFIKRYQDMVKEAGVASVSPKLESLLGDTSTATVQYKTHFETALFGPLDDDNVLSLVREANRWAIVWSDGNIMKDLEGGNFLKAYPVKSTRGNIYDRNGQPLAIGQNSIVVSVWPAEMRRQQDEAQVINSLSAMLNLSSYDLQRRYANFDPEWKIPVATVSKDVATANAAALSLPGVVTEEQDARAYPQGPVAAHIAGYIGEISPEELANVYAQGYREGDVIGRSGLERAGEKYLTGKRGGRLVVLAPSGAEVATLKEQPAQQSQSIYSTVDLDLETAADGFLGNKRGSITVMDVKNGNILAMVSHPSYDPNALVDSTRQAERGKILTDPIRPLLNRATQGAYPHGSVQKIVTISAALEGGRMTPGTTFT